MKKTHREEELKKTKGGGIRDKEGRKKNRGIEKRKGDENERGTEKREREREPPPQKENNQLFNLKGVNFQIL